MYVQHIDHFTLRTDKLDETLAFYTQVLGLKPGYRPPFAFAGAWLYGGNQHPLLHIAVWDPNDQALQRYLGERTHSQGSGGVDHIALRCTDLPAFEIHLQQLGIAYQGRTVPAVHEHQMFLWDPNGVCIECIFSANETASWHTDAQGVPDTSNN